MAILSFRTTASFHSHDFSRSSIIFSRWEGFVLPWMKPDVSLLHKKKLSETQNTKMMKTIAQLLGLALFVTTAACSKTDDTVPAASLSTTEKQEIITDTWVISSYIDHSKNETSSYAGYSFTFTDNGVLTATLSGTTFIGTWSIGSDHNGSDDSGHHSGNDSKLIISITGNYQINELSDDFQIVSISETEIVLKDDNLTKVKELRFTKK